MPAKALKRVVFPVFGFPTNTTVGVQRRTMGGIDQTAEFIPAEGSMAGIKPALKN
jgi:hypothetical protein